jgi:hypothetical protein
MTKITSTKDFFEELRKNSREPKATKYPRKYALTEGLRQGLACIDLLKPDGTNAHGAIAEIVIAMEGDNEEQNADLRAHAESVVFKLNNYDEMFAGLINLAGKFEALQSCFNDLAEFAESVLDNPRTPADTFREAYRIGVVGLGEPDLDGKDD